MFKMGIAAGCLFVAAGILAAQAQDDTFSAHLPGKPIPIFAGPDPSAGPANHFQFTIDPLVTQRGVNATGVQADSANEHFGLGYHFPLASLFTLGYDSGVNAFRQDATIFDDDGLTSNVTTALINKTSLEMKLGEKLKVTGYVQGQRSFADGQPGYSDATKDGVEAAWTPWKDVTTVKAQAAQQETVQFDRSILEEQVYTASLDQKLPYLPLTLHTGGSWTDDAVRLLPAQDKDTGLANASVDWKLLPNTVCSTGWQRQEAMLPASLHVEDNDAYFTQLALQPAPAWGVTVRAATEQRTISAEDRLLSTGSDILLTFGLNWKLADRWSAGFGMNYRALQTPAPAQAQGTPPASFSLSAGGSF